MLDGRTIFFTPAAVAASMMRRVPPTLTRVNTPVVGQRTHDRGEMHDRRHVAQVRRQVAAEHVDPVEFEFPRPAGGVADVETDDPVDVRAGVEQREEPLPEEARGAGHRDDDFVGHAP